MTKIKSIVGEEVIQFFTELFDPNQGNLYQPPGLDPKVVKLFENTNELYQSSLDDGYWKEISNKFPNYNDPESEDCDKAVEYVLNGMKQKYPDENWKEIETSMKKMIRGGIT